MIDILLLGYIGPDTMLPLASAGAVIVGVILACWTFLKRACLKAVALVTRKR